MLRVHFTPDDLARVRVAAVPDPLRGIADSFQLLVQQENSLVFGEWRRLVRPRLPQSAPTLAPLFPPRGYFPDFLTPGLRGADDLDSAVGTVLSTPGPACAAICSDSPPPPAAEDPCRPGRARWPSSTSTP